MNAGGSRPDEVGGAGIEADLVDRGAVRGAIKVQDVVSPSGRHLIPRFVFVGEQAWRLTMVSSGRPAPGDREPDAPGEGSTTVATDVLGSPLPETSPPTTTPTGSGRLGGWAMTCEAINSG